MATTKKNPKIIPTGDPSFDLWRCFLQTEVLISRARQRELSELGISTSIATVLDCVKKHGNNATATQLSRWTLRAPQSISGIIKRMEKQGLIRKRIDPQKKNTVRISLTEKAEKLYKEVLLRKSIKKIMSCLTEEEAKRFESCLLKLRKNAIKNIKPKSENIYIF